MFVDEIYDVYFYVVRSAVVGGIKVICNIRVVYFLVNVIHVFAQAIFDFPFCLSYILHFASGAFAAIYDIRTVACDIMFCLMFLFQNFFFL